MKTVIFTIGISASGKSTWARTCAMTDSSVRVIERDQLRQQFLCHKEGNPEHFEWLWSKWNFKWEKEITVLADYELYQFLCEDPTCTTIIIADTNLNPNRLENKIRDIQALGHECLLKFFPIAYEDAVKRDTAREHSVGPSVIARQLEQWNKMTVRQHEMNHKKKFCVICDIDGTIARMNDRSPYDYSKVSNDTPNMILVDILTGLANHRDYNIIFLSGREGSPQCRKDTIDWLNRYCFFDFQLFMRTDGDHRKDTVIKKELFEQHIEPFYSVWGVFDDRPSVVRMWRSMGLETFALGNQHLEF